MEMKNIGTNVKRSLLKQQEALERFKSRREDFLIAKEQITKEIEEAGKIWKNTLKQLPKQEFDF